MDHEQLLTAILNRISVHLGLIRDEHTRGICVRHIGVLLNEDLLIEAFLRCPQCHILHLSPVEMRACLARASTLDAVLNTLTTTPCPQALAAGASQATGAAWG
jgi:hypothetical protein